MELDFHPDALAEWEGIGDRMVVGAVGSEALQDPRGFRRATGAAEERLAGIEREESK